MGDGSTAAAGGVLDVLKRIAGKIDRLDSALSSAPSLLPSVASAPDVRSRSGGRGGRGGGDAELKTELKTIKDMLASAMISGPGGGGIQALRAELTRVSDAYMTAVKECRSLASKMESNEKEHAAQVAKLAAQAGGHEKLRREHGEALQQLKALRDKLESAQSVNAALRERLDDRTRARDSASVATSSMQQQITRLQEDLAEARTQATDAYRAKHELVDLRATCSSAESAIELLKNEKEALIETVEKLQDDLTRYQALASAASQTAKTGERVAHNLASAQETVDKQRSHIVVLEDQLARIETELRRTRSEAEDNSLKAAQAEELEAVQSELLKTISKQAGDLQEARTAAEKAAEEAKAVREQAQLDKRAVDRLERIVSNYQRLEHEFTKRTGQGFWGIFGIAASILTSPTVASLALPGRKQPTPRSTPGEERTVDEAMKKFMESVREEVSVELKAAHGAELDQQLNIRHGMEREVAELKVRMEDIRLEKEELAMYRGNIAAIEKTVGEMRPASTKEPAAPPDWHLIPVLASTLPNVCGAITTLRKYADECQKKARLAQGEVMDLREELRVLRQAQDSATANRSHAAEEMRAAARLALEARDRLNDALTEEKKRTESLVTQLQDAQDRIERYKDRVLRAKEMLRHADEKTSEASAEIGKLQGMILERDSEAAALRAQIDESKLMQQAAQRISADRDATITRLHGQIISLTLPSLPPGSFPSASSSSARGAQTAHVPRTTETAPMTTNAEYGSFTSRPSRRAGVEETPAAGTPPAGRPPMVDRATFISPKPPLPHLPLAPPTSREYDDSLLLSSPESSNESNGDASISLMSSGGGLKANLHKTPTSTKELTSPTWQQPVALKETSKIIPAPATSARVSQPSHQSVRPTRNGIITRPKA